jgi:hypothetical protein
MSSMLTIEGGTQALKRTINARLEIESGRTTVGVPSTFGAAIRKVAAYQADSRDTNGTSKTLPCCSR